MTEATKVKRGRKPGVAFGGKSIHSAGVPKVQFQLASEKLRGLINQLPNNDLKTKIYSSFGDVVMWATREIFDAHAGINTETPGNA